MSESMITTANWFGQTIGPGTIVHCAPRSFVAWLGRVESVSDDRLYVDVQWLANWAGDHVRPALPGAVSTAPVRTLVAIPEDAIPLAVWQAIEEARQ